VTELERQLLYRNARFRAWRTHGAPVEGEWRKDWREGYDLLLRCSSCGHALRADLKPAQIRYEGLADAMSRREAALLEMLPGRGCSHLAPLLDEDPQEVLALLELELLVG
jgi:hypothetical protein